MRTQSQDGVAAIGLLEEPVRRALYEWVVERGEPVSRDQASQAVGATRPLATFHLEKLVRAGLLDAGYQRMTGRTGPGAGRPARVYWRSPREVSVTLPERQYARVADVLARALEGQGSAEVPAPLVAAAREAGSKLGRASRRGSARARLLRALVDGGYEPIADATGTIRLRNCPFDALARTHRPLVCGANLAMAEGISKAVGASGLDAVLDPRPGWCCVAFVPSNEKG